MITIEARNVNDALPRGVALLRARGRREDSRSGPVLRVPGPVTTQYTRPCERVLFAPWRVANPFFHLVEALWMIAGRDDLRALTPFNPRMAEYSDDGGKTQPGAYGKRWRDHFLGVGDEHGHFPEHDQLSWVVRRLRADPNDRRVVIQMWDASEDPHRADHGGKDVPCNLTALPWFDDGRLCLTVFCRSNDIIWGAYGANAVHFSLLLEHLAGRLSVPVGRYWQVSNNFHGYLKTLPQELPTVLQDPYLAAEGHGRVVPLPLFGPELAELGGDVGDPRREAILQEDLQVLFDEGPFAYAHMGRWPFLRRVVVPMMLAHQHWRTKKGEERYTGALEVLQQMPADNDWRLAGEQWIKRRHEKWKRAADDGPAHVEAVELQGPDSIVGRDDGWG